MDLIDVDWPGLLKHGAASPLWHDLHEEIGLHDDAGRTAKHVS